MGFLHVHQYFQRREENLHTFSPSLSFSHLSCSISNPRCPQYTLCHTHSQSRTLTSIFPLSLTPPCCEFPLPAVWTLVFKQSARLTSGSKEDAGLRAACYCNGVLDLKFDWPNWTKWYLAGRSCPDCECWRMTDSTTRRWHGAQWCRGRPGISAPRTQKKTLVWSCMGERTDLFTQIHIYTMKGPSGQCKLYYVLNVSPSHPLLQTPPPEPPIPYLLL